MTTTRAYIAGIGSSTSLVAGAACVFLVTGAVVAFDAWPGSTLPDKVGSLVVNDRPVRATGPARPLPTGIAAGGAAVAAPGAGPAPGRRTGPTVKGRTRTGAPGARGRVPGAAPAPASASRPAPGSGSSGPGSAVHDVSHGAADTVRGVTKGAGDAVTPVSPPVGQGVTQTGQSVGNAVQDTGDAVGGLLPGP